MRRVRRQGDRQFGSRPGHELARRPLVVLDVPRTLDRVGVEVALELSEDLPVGLAHDVGEHVEASPMGHAQHGLGGPGVGALLEQRVEDHDRRLRSFETEALLPDVTGVEEALEGLGRVQPVEDVALLDGVERGADTLGVLLDPPLLVGVLDVHVLDAQGAAVGVAQDVERFAQGQRLAARQAVDHELAVEVPQRQAVGGGVELGVQRPGLGRQGVEIGDEMPTHPVHVDQALDVDLLHQAPVLAVAGIDVRLPAHRLVGHVHGREHRLVEVVVPGEALGDVGEEQPGLRPLDDAVVVGRRQRDHGPDADLRQVAAVGGLELGRVPERAHADDGALARHEPRHRLQSAKRSGVGEGDRRTCEVVRPGLAGVDLAHHLLVGDHESPEVESLGPADHRDQQGARAVGFLEVHGEAQADVVVVDHARLARAVHVGHEAGVEGGHRL